MKAKIGTWLKYHYPTVIGAVVGGIAGYIYHLQVGCTVDACPITADPYKITPMVAIMGGILGSYLDRKPDATK